MTSDQTPPKYGQEPALSPNYIDGASSSAPPSSNTKSFTTQKLWVQSLDITGMYRRRLFLPAGPVHPPHPDHNAASSSAPPPVYTETRTPLYTVKHHEQHSSISPRGSMSAKALQQPDFTIYVGESDEGPVVAVGMIHSNKLQKVIGAVRFFPRSSSNNGPEESSSSATERPSTIVQKSGDKKHVFELDGRQLEWEEIGPGEQREEEPTPPSPPPPPIWPERSSGSFFSKIKDKLSSPPKTPPASLPPRKTMTLHLHCYDPNTGVRSHIATYTELQPILSADYLYRHIPPVYKDGHCGALEIHDSFFTFSGASSEAPRDLAVTTLSLLLEDIRRATMRNKNRSWLSAPSMTMSMG